MEDSNIKGIGGKRAIGLSINPIYKYISVQIGRNNFAVGIYDVTLNKIYEKTFKYKSTKSTEMFNQILACIKSLQEKYENIISCGIAVPGPYDYLNGRILLMTEIDDSYDIHINEFFKNNLSIPVVINHDANAGALAASLYSESATTNLVYYLVGQGVGAGVINEGEILLGGLGFSGEIGHISIDINGRKCECGNHGCLEQYCSSIAFVRMAYKERTKYPESLLNEKETLTVKDVFHYAILGDNLAIKLSKKVSEYIVYGIINIINAYSPKTVVIGDEMIIGQEYIDEAVNELLKDRIVDSIYNELTIEYANREYNYVLDGSALFAVEYSLNKSDLLILK